MRGNLDWDKATDFIHDAVDHAFLVLGVILSGFFAGLMFYMAYQLKEEWVVQVGLCLSLISIHLLKQFTRRNFLVDEKELPAPLRAVHRQPIAIVSESYQQSIRAKLFIGVPNFAGDRTVQVVFPYPIRVGNRYCRSRFLTNREVHTLKNQAGVWHLSDEI